jgi:hypothetical protein
VIDRIVVGARTLPCPALPANGELTRANVLSLSSLTLIIPRLVPFLLTLILHCVPYSYS